MLEQLQRALETAQRRLEIGAVVRRRLRGRVQLREQLQRVPDMLAGRFDRRGAQRAAAPIQRAPPLRAVPQIDGAPQLHRDPCDGPAARHGPPVDAAASICDKTVWNGWHEQSIPHGRRACTCNTRA
jgi:hypothetical protein